MAGVSFSGFNGFDFGSIVDAIMQSESLPLAALQAQEQSVKDKNTAYSQLNGLIGKLQTQVNSLGGGTMFTNMAAVSSNTDTASVTVGSGATAGEYALDITFLAKGQVTSSTNGYTTVNDIAADGGTISFTIDGSTTADIAISGATTLADLKNAINDQDSGVVASVVNTGSSYKLVVSSRETGLSNGFTINNGLTNSGGIVVAFAPGQNAATGNTQLARDAEFTVNGLLITSASNNVTDAISGMTVKLLAVGNVMIDATPDYDTLKESLKTVVTDYNKLREFFNKQSTTDSISGKRGPLGNDSILRQALGDIRSVMLNSNANGGQYAYLSEIGLEFTTTGDMKLDETKYKAAISSDPDGVQALFQGAGAVNGVFDDLKKRLDGLDGTAGLIKTSRASLDNSLKSYRDRIESQQLRLAVRREELQRMYTAADQAISRLNSMSSQLSTLGSGGF